MNLSCESFLEWHSRTSAKSFLESNVKIIQGNKDTHNNDSDYILDCSGKPKSYEDYIKLNK